MSSAPQRPALPDRYGTLDQARATLLEHFGYPDFRAPQLRAVEAVLSGRDALVVLPTGGGKSLCFQVPALMRKGLTVVVSPLISLMKDQVDALVRRGISAAFINSTLGSQEVAERMARARDGSLRMLYLAPERMEAGRTLQQLAEIGVALLAVDEAHCISEWGHDFRPSYRRIGAIRARMATPQTVALTATATPEVRRDIVRQLALTDAEVVVAGFDRINLTYHVAAMRTQQEKDRTAVRWLREEPGTAIVYAPTRKAVERVTSMLVRARVKAIAYHGGLDDALRQKAQEAFMDGRVRVIVATSAFGMGIDKPDVRLVVHHAMPGTLESYYQEAGRAGRDGKASTCVLLHSYPDRFTHEFFIANAHPERRVVERIWKVLLTHTDAQGVAPVTIDDLAALLPSNVGPHRTGAAVRILSAAGACSVEPAVPGALWVRLLATPARITKELTGPQNVERECLRALWRAAGPLLERGALVHVDTLPRALGGASALVPILERLASRQFVVWTRTRSGLRVHPHARATGDLPVKWEALERRRRSDMERLDAMQRYAQTRYCRRAFVLRYFGDAGARAHCGACDRCLGSPKASPTSDPDSPVRLRSHLSRI